MKSPRQPRLTHPEKTKEMHDSFSMPELRAKVDGVAIVVLLHELGVSLSSCLLTPERLEVTMRNVAGSTSRQHAAGGCGNQTFHLVRDGGARFQDGVVRYPVPSAS